MIETICIIILVILTSYTGYMLKSLTVSGAISAIVVGLSVYIGLGINGLILLGVFFTTSSLWSKYKSVSKKPMEEKLAKGSTRDWRQVAANGGAATLFSIFECFHPDFIWLIGFIVSIGSANSDTWASELGSLSKQKPIFIRTWKRVERGTSGAISVFGTMAAIFGALLIAIVSLWLFQFAWYYCLIVFVFSYFGNVIDTIIGAFYQQQYVCRICGIETERKIHCQTRALRIKGLLLVDNDMVNFLSGFLAAIAAICTIVI